MGKETIELNILVYQVKVRVKDGVEDPDFPKCKLSGYTGILEWVDNEGTVSICWDEETMERIPVTICRKADEKKLDWTKMMLSMEDIEVLPR